MAIYDNGMASLNTRQNLKAWNILAGFLNLKMSPKWTINKDESVRSWKWTVDRLKVYSLDVGRSENGRFWEPEVLNWMQNVKDFQFIFEGLFQTVHFRRPSI